MLLSRIFLLLFVVFVTFSSCNPVGHQKGKNDVAKKSLQLLDALRENETSLLSYLHPDTRRETLRLAVRSQGLPEKFWMLYPDLEKTVAIREDAGQQLSAAILASEGRYQVSGISGSSDSLLLRLYWKDGQLISPADYFTRNWKTLESRFFRFRISDPATYHPYAAQQLDQFAEEVLDSLGVSQAEKQRLEEEKIIYCLAKDIDEVQEVSGFATRGVYLLGNDYIVSSFNCHRHEVAHLLINFALKTAPLYVHPFLQEGFASALGGRGDKAPAVIREIGAFLEESQFLTHKELLDARAFRSQDPSLTYPASALYNLFLMREWGMERYLKFYAAHGGKNENQVPPVMPAELPGDDVFQAFLKRSAADLQIIPHGDAETADLVRDEPWGTVRADSQFYYFRLRGSIRLIPENPTPDFRSAEFREIFPDVRYSGEQYVLSVSEDEVKLFNFYTATLQAFYARGLSTRPWPIRDESGMYTFALRRSALPENLAGLLIAQ